MNLSLFNDAVEVTNHRVVWGGDLIEWTLAYCEEIDRGLYEGTENMDTNHKRLEKIGMGVGIRSVGAISPEQVTNCYR
jgi:hypothetical protein